MSLILGSGFVALPGNLALAQNYLYGNNNSYNLPSDVFYSNGYSQYPTGDKKYECRTGPFEGFFVSSVEFCKFKFDKDDRKNDRDNNVGSQGPPGPKGDTGTTGATGPPGPKGDTGATGATGLPGKSIVGPPGEDGEDGAQGLRGFNGTDGRDGIDGTDGRDGINGTNGRDGINGTNGRDGINGTNGRDGINGTDGAQGPPGVTFLNGTNLYRVNSATASSTGAAGATATATCANAPVTDTNDFAISGDALVLTNFGSVTGIFRSEPTATGNGWMVTLNGGSTGQPITFQAVAICFENP
jgi:hypothetical protein